MKDNKINSDLINFISKNNKIKDEQKFNKS